MLASQYGRREKDDRGGRKRPSPSGRPESAAGRSWWSGFAGLGSACPERFEDAFARGGRRRTGRSGQRESRHPASGRGKLRAAFGAASQMSFELGLIVAVEHTKLVELEVLCVLGMRVHIPLFTKFRPKRSERGPQPRLDRAERISRAFRDFALGESFEVSEFHGLALCFR